MGLLPPLDIPRQRALPHPSRQRPVQPENLFRNPFTQPACASRPQPAAKPRPFPLYIQRPKGASFPFEPSAPGRLCRPNKKAPSFEDAFH